VTDELLFAIVYHDSIYNPSSNTNEEDSVSLAKLDLSGLGLNLNKISDLILSTKHHYHTTFADDDETQCMIDVDLSILGSPRDEYIEYSQSIREEYLFINYQTFSAARIDFLQKMLSRKQIFHKLTELESVARTNLYDEIVHLSR
jgi:predicted metal-dependent HD superfamily phosphohydrolase